MRSGSQPALDWPVDVVPIRSFRCQGEGSEWLSRQMIGRGRRMSKCLLVYRGGGMPKTPEARAQAMADWGTTGS